MATSLANGLTYMLKEIRVKGKKENRGRIQREIKRWKSNNEGKMDQR